MAAENTISVLKFAKIIAKIPPNLLKSVIGSKSLRINP